MSDQSLELKEQWLAQMMNLVCLTLIKGASGLAPDSPQARRYRAQAAHVMSDAVSWCQTILCRCARSLYRTD